MNRNNKANLLAITNWVIIAILLVCCVYLFFSKRNIEIILKEKQQITDSIKTDRTYLKADFDAASATIDRLMSTNTVLADSLQDKKNAIRELREQIRKILTNQKATQVELMEARDMIYMLNVKTQAYELYIAELEKDNTILTGENKLLSEERDNTVETNVALKMAGSVLHASNIRMNAIRDGRNGKNKETIKAKKANKIRIEFDIDENRIAESGTKQIYIRIIPPGGKVLYSDDLSGTFNTINGDEIKFSLLKEIDLIQNQSIKNVVVEWAQKEKYPQGSYQIELYHMGHRIGEGNIELK